VLYHLKDPLGGLERAAAMSHDLLIVETTTTMNHIAEPVLRFYFDDELGGDKTNFFSPNEACLLSMLRECGFSRFQTVITKLDLPVKNDRIIVHAWRA
jgi:tRNA (mo5U34)-methyltransferase